MTMKRKTNMEKVRLIGGGEEEGGEGEEEGRRTITITLQ